MQLPCSWHALLLLSYSCSMKVFVDMDDFLTVLKHLTSINQRRHENSSTRSVDVIFLFQAVQVTLRVDARLQMMWLDSVCVYLQLISLIQYMVASSCLDGADRTFVSTSRFSGCRWTSEDLLCSPWLRSKVELICGIFMLVHVHYTRTNREGNKSPACRKCFQ